MLTVFSTPKPFQGRFATIQRNAITSWTLLRPRPEVILFGGAPGTAEICRELGLVHVPSLSCNEYGTPLLPELFAQAQQLGRQSVLCYVNADIILLSDFSDALRQLTGLQRRFLMVGRRWDVSLEHLWEFGATNGEKGLREYVLRQGIQAPLPGNSDYFVFSRGLWNSIPPLAVGRGAWDAWLIYEARRLGAAVIDASSVLMAVHQSHDQSVYPHGLRRWRAEINRNFEIAGEKAAGFCLADATHVLTPTGLERPFGIRYLSRSLVTLPLFHPLLAAPLIVPKLTAAGVRLAKAKVTRARDPLVKLANLIHSKLPEDGITAILGLSQPPHGGRRRGIEGQALAHVFVWGGLPVVVYDPDPLVMEKARRALGGPVEFASSVGDCVREADVIVIAAPKPEFRSVPAEVSDSNGRVIIDCCALLKQEPRRSGLSYLSWEER